MRGDNRGKILDRWRAEFSLLQKDHLAAVAAHKGQPGRNDAAAAIVRKMRDLQNAIKAFSEQKMGEFPRAGARRTEKRCS